MTDDSVARQSASPYTVRLLTAVALLAYATVFSISRVSVPHWQTRLSDLANISSALEAYHADNGAYPSTPYANVLASGTAVDSWIPGLVPDYLPRVPRDPALSDDLNHQYLYLSDGVSYKLIAHAPEDALYVAGLRPEMMDPIRSEYAYGVWSAGGEGL